MKGFVKLHRDIVGHWLWTDPKQLRGWLYLLCVAAWEPRKIPWGNNTVVELERGQLVTTTRRLMVEIGYNSASTLQFLKLLEQHGMITREPHSKFTIITILNYEKYQDVKEKSERNSKHKLKQIKEREEIKEEKTIIIPQPSKEADEKFYEDFFNQEIEFETCAMHFHIEIDEVKRFAEEFKSEQLMLKKYHRDFSDLRHHFVSWLRIKLNSQKSNNNGQQRKSKQFRETEKTENKYGARRGTNAERHSPDDYEQPF